MSIGLNKIVFVFFIVVAISCNKNSNELPPSPKVPAPVVQDTIQTTIKAGDNDVLSVRLIQKTENGKNIITATLTNLTGQDIDNLKLLIQVLRNNNENYDNVNLQKEIGPLTVKSAVDTTYTLYQNENITLKDSAASKIVLRAVSYKTATQLYAGTYAGVGGYAYYIVHDTGNVAKNYYGPAQGFIQVDGKAAFFLKGNNATYINIYNSFRFANNYSGNMMLLPGNETIPFDLDSISTASGKTLVDTANGKLHVRLKPKKMLADSVNAIELILTKN